MEFNFKSKYEIGEWVYSHIFSYDVKSDVFSFSTYKIQIIDISLKYEEFTLTTKQTKKNGIYINYICFIGAEYEPYWFISEDSLFSSEEDAIKGFLKIYPNFKIGERMKTIEKSFGGIEDLKTYELKEQK